jgi:hypothetical protein
MDLLQALRAPGVTRILYEGPERSGRTSAVEAAVRDVIGTDAYAADWVTRVTPETVACLKTLDAAASIATYTRCGSFRIVIVDDVEIVMENRTRASQLLAFLDRISCVSTPIKAVVVARPGGHLKRLRRPGTIDVVVKHTDIVQAQEPAALQQVREYLDLAEEKEKEEKELTGAQLSHLLTYRWHTLELLAEAVSSRQSRQTQETAERRNAERRYARLVLDAQAIEGASDFDETASDIAACIKILAARELLKREKSASWTNRPHEVYSNNSSISKVGRKVNVNTKSNRKVTGKVVR